jgi:hypothetical protein
MNFKEFFEPNYQKLYWFFLIFFVAQLYAFIIMPFLPNYIIQEFINFILNPFSIILNNFYGIETNLAKPLSLTFNLIWNYFLANIIITFKK